MAPSAMLRCLAAVARKAREDAGRKPYNIASTARGGMAGADPSTVWRFEQGENWPQNADHMIDLYAADLGIEPLELWTRALELWRSQPAVTEGADESATQAAEVVADVAGQLGAAGESTPRKAPGRPGSGRGGSRRKRA